VNRVEIFDYKTDDIQQTAELISRYQGQMAAYRHAIQSIYPEAEVVCSLLSMKTGELISI